MHDSPPNTPTHLPPVARRHGSQDVALPAAEEAPCRLEGPALVALQLWVGTYSLRQIGLLLAAKGQQRGTSLDHSGLTATARFALASALTALGCATVEEAVALARARGLIA
jgi:hypothetical protein